MKTTKGKRTQAMQALLTHGSVREAARQSGISEATLYRYLSEQDFREEHRRARREALDSTVAKLQSATAEAVETLVRNLRCENPAVEVRTAQIILENAQKGLEATELVERVEELEKTIEKQKTAKAA